MQLFDLEFWLHIDQNSSSGKEKLGILNFTDIYFFNIVCYMFLEPELNL